MTDSAMEGYVIVAEKGDYRLVSDPDCRWHIQCISTGAWYTEASGGLFDESQTRERYFEVLRQYFPEHDDPEPRCNECDAIIEDFGEPCEWCDTAEYFAKRKEETNEKSNDNSGRDQGELGEAELRGQTIS